MKTHIPHITVILLLLAMAGSSSLASAAGRAMPSGDQIQVTIEKLPGSGARRGTVSGLVEASPERVWAVVSQYNDYKTFMPRFAEGMILDSNLPASFMNPHQLKSRESDLQAYKLPALPGDTFLFYNRLDLPSPLGDKRYILKMMRDPAAFSEHWFQVAGDMKVNEGSWVLQSVGDKTLATYTTVSDPGMPVPGFLLNLTMKSTLPDIIKAVRQRVREEQR
jgi:hypothetical protein